MAVIWSVHVGKCAIVLGFISSGCSCLWETANNKNSPGDTIANVNFFATTPSTTFTQCAPEATEFGEITQNKGH